MSKTKVTTGHNAIVAAFVSAYETAENTGSKLADVCKLANATYKGKEIPEDEAQSMAQMIADARGWSGDTSKVRRSEICKVFSVYNTLPEGITTVREKRGSCNWRDALKLATCLKKNDGKLKDALAAFEEQGEGNKSTPQGRAAGALKGWYKVAKGDKRAKILEAANLLGLKLGIKLDA
jgi:hypothetical protein